MRCDQQVNVFQDREASKAVLASLYDALRREDRLKQEVERYQKEDSVNHALAGLLSKGAMKETPFRGQFTAVFKNPRVSKSSSLSWPASIGTKQRWSSM